MTATPAPSPRAPGAACKDVGGRVVEIPECAACNELLMQIAALQSEVDELLYQAGKPLKYGGQIG